MSELIFEEKVKAAKDIDNRIDSIEKQMQLCKEELEALNVYRTDIYSSLLTDVKERKITDEQVGDVFVTLFQKEDIAWLDDEGLLKKLQDDSANEFIKVTTKVTTSIDKAALKKAFKKDEALKEQYKDFYGTKLTEYVTITTEENHRKMLEHIDSKS